VRRFIYVSIRALTSFQRAFRERLTPAGWVVLTAAGVAAAAGVDTTLTVTYQAFAFFAALILIAGIGAPLRRARVSARRELPRYATAGEPLSYSLAIVNHGARAVRGAVLRERLVDPRPAYAEWRAAREPGEERRNWFDRNVGFFRWQWLVNRRLPRHAAEVELDGLEPGERKILRLTLTPRRRGRIELAGLTLGRADPFGLVKGLTRVPLPGRVTALPKRYRLPPLALPGKRRFQQGGVSLATSIGDSEEIVGLRDYRPGDPLQKIHWKSTARAGKPIVKEFQDEFFERHALVLDTARAAGEDAVFEDAVAVAASFVYTVDTRECLLDLLFAGAEVHAYTTGRGQMSPDHLLEILAAVAPCAPQGFGELARAVRGRIARMSSAILVLVAWDDERRALAEALLASGLELRALLVCQPGERPERIPPWLRMLHPGEIEAGLARLA
jgi:uncharacterized protein (DUF58 family)